MRAICKVCQEKDSCTYIKRCLENDCIDVQTSDYGYEEAVNKAVEWIFNHNGDNEVVEQFKKAMEL